MAIRTRKKQSPLRLWLLVALLVVVVVVIFMLPTADEAVPATPATEQVEDETEATTIAKAGTVAPDFTVTMFDGSTQTPSALKGKVVLVNFWATWCPPCREELKRVEADIIERFKDAPFVFIPISRGEERQTVADFREKMGNTFPMGLDPERKIYDLYASNFIPRNFLVDQNGQVVIASVGYEPEEFDALIAKIEELVKQ